MLLEPRRPATAPALNALGGVGSGRLKGAFGEADALQPDGEPGVVHHREHAGQSLVRRPQHEAHSTLLVAIGDDAGGRGVDAELLLELAAAPVVAAAEAAIGAGEEFRDDEERDALGPGRGVGEPGEDQMDDVLGHVVVAPGDVDLLAPEPVVRADRGVVGRRGGGPDGAEIRARLRLGEAHRPGPAPGHHWRHERGLLPVGAVVQERLDRALRQERADLQGHVGGVPDLAHRRVQGPGQGLPAIRFGKDKAHPAGLAEACEGLPEAGCGAHRTVLEHRTVPVADRVQGGQHRLGEAAGLGEDGLAQALIESGPGQQPIEPDDMVEHEAELVERCPVGGHHGPTALSSMGSSRPVLAHSSRNSRKLKRSR